MIKLERERTSEAVTSGLRGKRRVDKALRLLEEHLKGEHDFKSDYWKKAKDQLKKETAGKCAYCEAATDTVAHGDVEHFRPKTVYWWLAYCYDNYLFSCQICNQSYKGNNFTVHGVRMELDPPLPEPFPDTLNEDEKRQIAARFAPDPLKDDEGRPMDDFLQAAEAEEAGLIDPYAIDPEPFFKWEADDVLKEVRVLPRQDTQAARRAHEAAEQFLGLNREELLRWRWKTYHELEVFKQSLEALAGNPIAPQIQAMIRDMMASSSQFAAMVRHFARDVWQLDLG